MIISYPTSSSGRIVLLKTPPKYRKLDYNKNKKAKKKHAYAPIFVDHGIMAKAVFTLGLDYDRIIIELNMKWVHIN